MLFRSRELKKKLAAQERAQQASEKQAKFQPERLLEAAVGVLRSRPPAGLSGSYVEGFYRRNRAQLLELVRQHFGEAA